MGEKKYIDYWRDRQAKQAADSKALARQAWAHIQQIARLLRSEFGVTRIIVFGSMAKGDGFDAESDIAILNELWTQMSLKSSPGKCSRMRDNWQPLWA